MAAPDAPELRIAIQIGVSHRELRTAEPVVLIGRADPAQEHAPEVDLAQDESVSRRHAEIRRTPEGYTITDLTSKNGTWVNGKRIVPGEAIRLKDGDRVAVGRLSVLTITLPGTEPDRAAHAGTS